MITTCDLGQPKRTPERILRFVGNMGDIPMASRTQKKLRRHFFAGGLVPLMLLLLASPAAATTSIDSCVSMPSAAMRAGALILGALIVAIAGFIATGGKLKQIFVGADNRYSNSICQVAIWFGIMMSCYLAALFLRLHGTIGCTSWLVGGIDIPGQLAAMSGLSALTFAGAKAVTVQKDAAAKDANLRQAPKIRQGTAERVPEKTAAVNPPRLADLFQNDQGQFDIGDFQMLFITVIAAAIYVLATFAFLGTNALMSANTSLPPVDSSLLAAFGISQGAYLAKKAASPPGQG